MTNNPSPASGGRCPKGGRPEEVPAAWRERLASIPTGQELAGRARSYRSIASRLHKVCRAQIERYDAAPFGKGGAATAAGDWGVRARCPSFAARTLGIHRKRSEELAGRARSYRSVASRLHKVCRAQIERYDAAPFGKGGAATAAGDWVHKPGAQSSQSELWGFIRLRRIKRRSRPISRVLSWTVIPLGATSPLRSSNLPGPDAGRVMRSLFGLAPGGVCRAGLLPGSRCALTAPFHPCHALLAKPFGGIFLLHFPSARAAQALPGTVPCGARTFLGTRTHRSGRG